MRTCFETIRLEGLKLQRLRYHNERMNRTRRALWGCTDDVFLEEHIVIPEDLTSGVYKCRVRYSTEVERIEFEPYTIRPVRSILLVEDEELDYRFKWAERSCFARHLENSGSDDILIVQRGCLTDTSYANIAFFDGVRWLTPATPLLAGTCRQRLLDKGLLTEAILRPDSLSHFRCAKLINAMLGWAHSPILPMEVFKVT